MTAARANSSDVGGDILIGVVEKNSHEEIRVLLRRWRGLELFDIRIFAKSAGGEMKPTREGCALAICKLPELRRLVVEAEAEATRLALITDEEAAAC